MGREWYFNWGKSSSSKKRRASGSGGGGAVKGGERQTAPAATATVAAAAATAGGCMNAVLHLFDFNHFQLCLHPHDNTSSSTITPVQPTTCNHDPTSPKGVEAPRNSLETEDEMFTGQASLASITEDEKDDISHIPMAIEIKPNGRRDTRLKQVQAPRAKMEDLSSESTDSPASARTPNVVARLMGLEILPQSNTTTPRSSSCQIFRSPRVSVAASTPPSTSKTKKTKTRTITRSSYDNDVPGPQSLPETPRLSSSTLTRRRSTDIVDHHRLSLQINNKENSIVKEMESSRPSCSAISTKRREGFRNSSTNYEEGSRSPGYYARQIMKQVRETVSRRVGLDITNTVGNREIRRDEHLLTTTTTNKPKKSSKKESSPGKNLPPTHSMAQSPSPRFKTCEPVSENQPVSEHKEPEEPVEVLSKVVDKLITKSLEDEKVSLKKFSEKPEEKLSMNKSETPKPCSKKLPPKSFDSIRNKKDEQFVVRPPTDKKTKKTPLSSDLLHGTVPSLVPLKKDSSSPKKLLDKQGASSKFQPLKSSTSISTRTRTSTNTTSQLSRSPSQRYERVQIEATHMPAVQERKIRSSSKDSSSVAEFQYISRILKCTGIDRDTPVSFTRWFSPSNPLNPSIYHNLEAAHYAPTTTSDTTTTCCSPHDQLGPAINRKLIFHLVDEILADILKPYIKLKPWLLGCSSRQDSYYHHQQQQQQINGFQLVKTLCTRIRSFPSANCEILQDIDSLVEKDLPGFGAQSNMIAFEEEGEAIVSEIERDIVDSLVQEIVVVGLGNHYIAMHRYVTSNIRV